MDGERRIAMFHFLMLRRAAWLAALVLVVTVGCKRADSSLPGAGEAARVLLPGANDQKTVQTALIEAAEGDTIEFGEGTFRFTGTLSLDVKNVRLRGRGPDKTILSFADQQAGAGGEGLLVTSDGFVLEDLAIVDTRGDGVKVNDAVGVTIRNVRVEWTGGPKETNGGYGLYPVLCKNVLIEHCVARGASDAGIYVGQSENIIVRRNRAEQNVAGIEIENSIAADVYENHLTDNTGGVLVFTLPDLDKKVGRQCRVFRNTIVSNNRQNFAPAGNIVATVPAGTGMSIMASDEVEVFENEFRDNRSVNLAIISYFITQLPINDPQYDPYTEGVHIHHNKFIGGGDLPDGALGALLRLMSGLPLPDIIYDGAVDPKKQVDGATPRELGVAIHDNDDADFLKFDITTLDPENILKSVLAGSKPGVERSLEPYEYELPRLPAVELPHATQ